MNLLDPEWFKAPSTIPTPCDAVHVWRFSLIESDEVTAYYQSLLSDDELTRAKQFHFDKHRMKFIIGRGRLREILSRYLGKEPVDISFEYNDFNKPSLPDDNNPDKFAFNLSHSNDVGLLAITTDCLIGVDIEYRRADLAGLEIAKRFFSDDESQQLLAYPKSLHETIFFMTWTCKEAFIKAVGEGLSYPLKDFVMKIHDAQHVELVRIEKAMDEVPEWTTHVFQPEAGYIAAFACKKSVGDVCYYEQEPPLGQTARVCKRYR